MYTALLIYFVVMPFVGIYVTADIKRKQRLASMRGKTVKGEPSWMGATVAIFWPPIAILFLAVVFFGCVSWLLDRITRMFE